MSNHNSNSQPDGFTIRQLDPQDTEEMARALGEAFAADLPIRRLLGCGRNGIFSMWRAMAPFLLTEKRVECWGAIDGTEIRSVAIMVPDPWIPSPRGALGVGRRMIKYGGLRMFFRGIRMMVVSAGLNPQQPCWRLFALGSDNLARGKGYGTAMLRHIAAEYGARDVPAIQLEVEDVNRAKYLYEREGYIEHRRATLDHEEFIVAVKQLCEE